MPIVKIEHTNESRIFLNENHDNCTLCGYSFFPNDTTSLGYLQDGSLANVCKNCLPQIKRLIVGHIFSKRKYIVPEDNALLWRYMDFSKYVSLISSQKLFFPAVQSFDDPYEGAKGVITAKKKWDDFYLQEAIFVIKNPPPGYTCDKTEEEVLAEAQKLMENSSGTINRDQHVFISCWHENETESEAMWNLYSKENNAIALRVTYQDFYNSIYKNPNVSIEE